MAGILQDTSLAGLITAVEDNLFTFIPTYRKWPQADGRDGTEIKYSRSVKRDTETGRLKVYNHGHAQTICCGLQSPRGTRTPQRGEVGQSTRRRTWRGRPPFGRGVSGGRYTLILSHSIPSPIMGLRKAEKAGE